MSSKIGLLISLIFFSMFFLLSIDIMCIQFSYSDLDSKSVYVAYDIARCEELDEETIKAIEDKHHVLISEISSYKPEFGEVVEFILVKEYKPLIISNKEMEIKVKRSTIIGYY